MTDPNQSHPEPPEDDTPVDEKEVQDRMEHLSPEGRPIELHARRKGLHAFLAFALIGAVIILFFAGIVGGWLAIGMVAFLLIAYALIGGLPRIGADTMRTKEEHQVIHEIKEEKKT